MSTPSRGRGAVTVTRGSNTTVRGRGSSRGSITNGIRGRGRGRGTGTTAPNNPGGLLQKLRTGTIQQQTQDHGASTTNNGRARGTASGGQLRRTTRGRGSISKSFNTPQATRNVASSRPSSPAPPTSHRDFMTQMNDKFQTLKTKRDVERKEAINNGFLADPDKKTNLENAITPVGTCTDMCPQFERVERIVQNMVDRAEKVSNTATGRDVPSEDRMVKRFRRSAAGYDEQMPSDIRTPETLRRTLDYLLDKVIGGGERLATVHKFVWDRTRGIRNDFSIQQVTKKEDVKIAVECFERIARFHILSLHQLSNPHNLQEGEHFDAHQEREQLNNTLLSLMYYYDDNQGVIPLPNEPEFRAYCILFEIQALTPDLEDRMQAWPVDLLRHPKVQTAYKLHAAAANTIADQGPLRPSTPFSVAQSNSGKFWTILASQAVSYIMACVAEMHFSIVRFTALDALWRSAKSAPQGQQARNQEWTLSELQNYLAFDDEDETLEFCQAFDLAFTIGENGEQCLDFTAVAATTLDKSMVPTKQVFSQDIVEEKRHRRTLVAVINGIGIASAIRQGLVMESADEGDEQEQDTSGEDQSMFIPERSEEAHSIGSSPFGSNLNAAAAAFTPSSSFGETSIRPSAQPSIFGQARPALATPVVASLFGSQGGFPAANPPQPMTGKADGVSRGEEANPFQQQPQIAKPIFGQSPAASLSPVTGFPSISNSTLSPSSSTAINPSPALSTSIFAQDPPAQSTKPIFGPTTGTLSPTTVQPISADKPPEQGSSTNSIFGQDLTKHKEQEQEIARQPTDTTLTTGSVFTPNLSNVLPQQPSISASSIFAPRQQLPGPTPHPDRSVAKTSSFPSFSFAPSTNEQTSLNSQKPTFSFPSTVPKLPEESSQAQPNFSFTPQIPAPQVANNSFSEPTKPLPIPAALGSSGHAKQPKTRDPAFTFPSQTTQEPKSVVQHTAQASKLPGFPTFEPSSTPKGTPQRPQLGELSFPKVPAAQAITGAISGTQPIYGQKCSMPKPPGDNDLPEETPTLVPALPSGQQQPVKPEFTEGDRAMLVENTCRIILTQPQGLIEYFVSHHVSNVLSVLVKQYLKEQHDEVMTRIRSAHLSRKFFAIWRGNTQRNILGRRSKQRRKLLAAAMQAERERKTRDETELEAILAAAEETKRLQEELKRSKSSTEVQDNHDGQTQKQHPATNHQQIVGQKRKTAATTNSPNRALSTTQRMLPSHKRSRTIGTMSEPSTSLQMSTSGGNFRTSTLEIGTTRFGQSLNRSINLAALPTRKVDTTRTDYFKLKAMGIDPNTPLIPDTAKSLEVRKDEEQQARDALLSRSKIRPSGFSTASTPRTSQSPAPQPPLTATVSQPYSPSISTKPPMHPSIPTEKVEDDFLRQLREARQALAHDADWFKNQTAVLEKEIEQREDLRLSQSSQNSDKQDAYRTSINGHAAVHGYEYCPAEYAPGKSLSRTEQRIRRTGAHGLATKPPRFDYVPVAMSRQTALRYSYSANDNVSPTGQKRARGDWNNSLDLRHNPFQNNRLSSPPVTKRQKDEAFFKKTISKKALASASLNTFAALQNHDYTDQEIDEKGLEGEEEEEEEGEEEIDNDDINNDPNYYYNGTDADAEGDTDSNAEFDGEEEEDSTAHEYPLLPDEERVYDDEEDEEDEEGADYDDGTPGTYPNFSRAHSGASSTMLSQTGPGASADDALVLSD